MYEFKINPSDVRKSKLTLPEYLVLAYLRFFDNKLVSDFTDIADMMEQAQLVPIMNSLANMNYIRIIDGVLHVSDIAENLFLGAYEVKAQKLLQWFNKMKEEYLHISRPTNAKKYAVKFKTLLAEGHDVDYIKEVMEFCIVTWKDDDFMRNHINIETICRHFDKYADQYEMRQKSANRINRML